MKIISSIILIVLLTTEVIATSRLLLQGDPEGEGTGSYAPNVVGGDEVKPAHKYPWVVSLQWKGNHVCGGTLIKPDLVLTAAHCSTGTQSEFQVAIHRHNLAKTLTEENAETFKIQSRFVHEAYDAMTNFNDVALWKLDSPYQGQFVSIPLDDGKATSPGSSVMGIGWGRVRVDGPLSPILMQVEVSVTKPESCIDSMKEQGYAISTELQVCAGTPEGGKDTCQGDSGGPLISIKDGNPILVGITSFGISCALPNVPGIYTRISGLRSWIEGKIAAAATTNDKASVISSPSSIEAWKLQYSQNRTRFNIPVANLTRNIPVPGSK